MLWERWAAPWLEGRALAARQALRAAGKGGTIDEDTNMYDAMVLRVRQAAAAAADAEAREPATGIGRFTGLPGFSPGRGGRGWGGSKGEGGAGGEGGEGGAGDGQDRQG